MFKRFSRKDDAIIVKRCKSPICNNLIYRDQWGWANDNYCPGCTLKTIHYKNVTGIATRVDKKK